MDKRNRILEAKKVKSVRCLYWLHSLWCETKSDKSIGGTEIYFALWTLLDRMQPGQTLVVISDFRASVALSGRELQRIEQKIREAGEGQPRQAVTFRDLHSDRPDSTGVRANGPLSRRYTAERLSR